MFPHLLEHFLVEVRKDSLLQCSGHIRSPVCLTACYHHLTRPLQHPLSTGHLGEGEGEGGGKGRGEGEEGEEEGEEREGRREEEREEEREREERREGERERGGREKRRG